MVSIQSCASQQRLVAGIGLAEMHICVGVFQFCEGSRTGVSPDTEASTLRLQCNGHSALYDRTAGSAGQKAKRSPQMLEDVFTSVAVSSLRITQGSLPAFLARFIVAIFSIHLDTVSCIKNKATGQGVHGNK